MKRRSFVRSLAATVALGALNAPCRSQGASRQASRGFPPRVVVVRREGLSRLSGEAKAQAYHTVVSAGLRELGEAQLRAALAGRTSVGLKLNCLAGRPLSPCPELVEALAGRLGDLGVRRVVAWDRSMRELARAGFATRGTSYTVTATDAVGYGGRLFESGNVGSLVSNALLETDAVVSVGVLKDHDLAGISCALKNLYGVIHNPNKYHGSNCDPFIAEVVLLEPVRERLFLSVLDGALAQCHGGPSFKEAWTWAFEGVLFALDPVALDRVAADLIEEQRATRGLPSLREAKRPPSWIDSAARLGLGEARREAIETREVEA